jgi:hypothetical protein
MLPNAMRHGTCVRTSLSRDIQLHAEVGQNLLAPLGYAAFPHICRSRPWPPSDTRESIGAVPPSTDAGGAIWTIVEHEHSGSVGSVETTDALRVLPRPGATNSPCRASARYSAFALPSVRNKLTFCLRIKPTVDPIRGVA